MRINLELADLRAFVAVAELGSFRAGAQAVHRSQPALSRRIDKLEDALGVRLFERTTRRVSLTVVGRAFARKARALLDELDAALLTMREVASSQGGEVTIACVSSAVYYFLPVVVRRYHELYPRIRVRIIDDTANEVLAAVLRGEADFGLNFIGVQEPELEFRPVLKEPFVLACRRDHSLARRRRLAWGELAGQDFMTVAKRSGNRLLIDEALTGLKASPTWFYEVRHVSTLLGLVEAGLGVAALPRIAMPPGRHPTLVSVPLDRPVVTRTLGLIRRRGRALAPAAQELYTLLSAARR